MPDEEIQDLIYTFESPIAGDVNLNLDCSNFGTVLEPIYFSNWDLGINLDS